MKYLTFLLFAVLLVGCGQLEGNTLTLKTADPNLGIGVRLLPAPQPEAPVVVPSEEVTCLIKGNINSAGERIAHSPGQANYEQTIVDTAKGERCFTSLEEAQAAGWRAAQR